MEKCHSSVSAGCSWTTLPLPFRLAVDGAPFIHKGLERRLCMSRVRRGRGVFANVLVRRGARLLAVGPLAYTTVAPLDDTLALQCATRAADDARFAEEFWSLSDGAADTADVEPSTKRRCVEDLVGNDDTRAGLDVTRAKSVVHANAHQLPLKDRVGLGLWVWHAYMNHSELATANCTEALVGDVMLVRATRDINAGEEVLISYTSPSASLALRRSILSHCKVPVDEFSSSEVEMEFPAEQRDSNLARISAALQRASDAFSRANMLAHSGVDRALEAEAEFRRVLAETLAMHDVDLTDVTAPLMGQLHKTKLRAARCLGDMRSIAAAHARLAQIFAVQRPEHMEVLAHVVAYLRAGGQDVWAMQTAQSLSQFWLGSHARLGQLTEWLDQCRLSPHLL